jgi:hypothetical protein
LEILWDEKYSCYVRELRDRRQRSEGAPVGIFEMHIELADNSDVHAFTDGYVEC